MKFPCNNFLKKTHKHQSETRHEKITSFRSIFNLKYATVHEFKRLKIKLCVRNMFDNL